MSLANAVGNSVGFTVPTVPTYFGILVDKSGSMYPYQEIVSEGVNQLVAEQSKIKGAGLIKLAEFSHDYNIVMESEFAKIDPKFSYNYQPDGGTCLYDSIIKITSEFEKTLEKASKKPKNIVIAFMTDGQDSGCQSSAKEAKEVIKSKLEKGWKFVGLVNDDSSLTEVKNLGISEDHAAIFDGNVKGGFDLLKQKISAARKGKPLAITDGERLALASSKEKRDL